MQYIRQDNTIIDGTKVPVDLVFGAIIGIVEVIDCVRIEDLKKDDIFATGPWCWILENPRPLSFPVVWKGQLGLFEVPDKLIERVN